MSMQSSKQKRTGDTLGKTIQRRCSRSTAESLAADPSPKRSRISTNEFTIAPTEPKCTSCFGGSTSTQQQCQRWGPDPIIRVHGFSDGVGVCPKESKTTTKHEGSYADACAHFKFELFDKTNDVKLESMFKAGMIGRKRLKASDLKKSGGH